MEMCVGRLRISFQNTSWLSRGLKYKEQKMGNLEFQFFVTLSGNRRRLTQDHILRVQEMWILEFQFLLISFFYCD